MFIPSASYFPQLEISMHINLLYRYVSPSCFMTVYLFSVCMRACACVCVCVHIHIYIYVCVCIYTPVQLLNYANI